MLRLFAETFESAAMLLLLPTQNTGLLPAGAAVAVQQKVLTIDTASSSSAIIEVINPGAGIRVEPQRNSFKPY